MRTQERPHAAIAVAAILVAGLMPGDAVAADRGAPAMLSSVRDSASLSGPSLLDGQLVDARGVGVSGRVRVIAWPVLDVLGALGDGDSVRTIYVAAASPAADGRFTLRIDPAVPIAEFTEADGTVNFSLLAEGPTGRAVHAFAGRLESASNAWLAPGSSTAERGRARAHAVVLPLNGPLPQTTAIGEPRAATDKVWPCTDVVHATYNQRLVSIGEVYPGPHATGDYVYTSGAQSSLGIAVSFSGEYGSYEQSGTASTSSTSEINYPTQASNARTVFRTTYQYKKFRVYVPTDFGCQASHWEVRPTAFDGGASQYTAASLPTANYCSVISVVPTTVVKQTADAVEWSNAVKLGSVIGLEVSGRTGFSTAAKISFRFTSPGQLCGTNASWPNAKTVRGK